MPYDLLIENARIVDGSGGPSKHGSVAVTDGRIVAVCENGGAARNTLDAHELVVAPGFIDVHTHYDAQLAWDPFCTPSSYHGITTVVMSNCGYSMAPVRAEDRDYTMGLFSCVEGISKHTLINGLPWEWETTADYLRWLRDRGLGVNAAVQVGHSAVRRYVMGSDAVERQATPEEVEAMAKLVREGMEAGAIGFTTSRVAHQKGESGEPIPSFVAAESELFALADVLRDMGRGIIGINPRTKALDFVQEDRDQLYELGRRTGRPVNWNEFGFRPDKPDQWHSLLEYMENAQRHGSRVYAVMRCQRADMPFTLRDTHVFDKSDVWREFRGLSDGEKLARLRDSEARAALAAEMDPSSGFGRFRLKHVGVSRAALEKNRSLEGRPAAELAQERGVELADFFLDLAVEENLSTEFGLLGNNDEKAVERMLRSPATITGISDAGAHLHDRCGADYPNYYLRRWVREKGTFSLEEAVSHLSSVPASIAGLAGRGRIETGAAADLCIFDPDSLDSLPVTVSYDLPGGESRLVKEAVGMEWVIVNGEVILEKGEATGALPGQVLSG